MTTTEQDALLQWFIDEQIVEKYISKYLNGRSDFIKEEAYQICWKQMLESNWKTANDPKSFLMRVVRNQLFSDSSELYYTHLQPLSRIIPNDNLFNLTDEKDYISDYNGN